MSTPVLFSVSVCLFLFAMCLLKPSTTNFGLYLRVYVNYSTSSRNFRFLIQQQLDTQKTWTYLYGKYEMSNKCLFCWKIESTLLVKWARKKLILGFEELKDETAKHESGNIFVEMVGQKY